MRNEYDFSDARANPYKKKEKRMTEQRSKRNFVIRFIMTLGMAGGIYIGALIGWWGFLVLLGFVILSLVLTALDIRKIDGAEGEIYLGDIQEYLAPFTYDAGLTMNAMELTGKTLHKVGYTLMSGKVDEGKAHELWAKPNEDTID